MIRRFLYWWTNRLPGRIISVDGKPYMERYFVMRLRGGWAVYVHRFVGSDPNPGVHNHPWRQAVSLVLAGGYEEVRLCDMSQRWMLHKKRWLHPLSINWIGPNDFHRIVMTDGQDCWTLFAHGPRSRGWGFLSRDDSGQSRFAEHVPPERDGENDRWWQMAPTGLQLRQCGQALGRVRL